MSEYASSSTRVVCLLDAQDIFCAMLNVESLDLSTRTSFGILVTSVIISARDERSPSGRGLQSPAKKKTWDGATSSWRVHPRVNQALRRNRESRARGSSSRGTSSR